MKSKVKNKVIFTIVSVLLLSMSIFSYSVIELYRKDKSAYIFEMGLDRNENIKKYIFDFVNVRLKQSVVYNDLNHLQNIVLTEQFNPQPEVLAIGELSESNEISFTYNRNKGNISLDNNLISKIVNTLQKESITIHYYDQDSSPQMVVGIAQQPPQKNLVLVLTSLPIYSYLTDESSSFSSYLINYETKKPIFNQQKLPIDLSSVISGQGQIDIGGSKIIKGNNQEDYLVTYNPVKGLNTTIITLISKNEAFTAITEFKSKSIYFALFILFISFGVGIYFASSIMNPLRKLQMATQRISSGNFNEQVEIKTKDELEVLANSFNTMQIKIQDLLQETAEKARMAGEIKVAQSVQDTLFPDSDVSTKEIELCALNESASECGGDWWTYEIVGNKLFYTIMDATGHGVGPALVISAVASATYLFLKDKANIAPDRYLKIINNIVKKISKGKINVTAFCCVFDLDTKKMSYSNAGQPFPYLLKNGTIEKIDSGTMKRLGENDVIEVDLKSFDMAVGDTFFFYTDGLTDRESDKGTKLGEKRLKKKLLEFYAESDAPSSLRDTLRDFIKGYAKHRNKDDITYSFIKIKS